jgi:hypothetical protein
MQHCNHRRYHSWRLHHLNPQNLPELSSIQTLVIGEETRFWSDFSGKYERPIDLRVVTDLVSKLPNLETLDCRYLHDHFPYPYEDAVISHFTQPWEGPRCDARHHFGKAAIEAHTPTTLKRAKFHFGAVNQLAMAMDQSKPLPNLKRLSYDPLSSALRVFSLNLTDLDLRICTDSTLLWPSSSSSPSEQDEPDVSAAAGPPSWPHLKHLQVEFHPASSSGRWYFAGPRGEGRDATGYEVKETEQYPPVSENEADEEWDETWNFEGGRPENVAPDIFRTVPVDEVIETLLGAFGRALACMPKLEEAELFTYLSWCPGEEPEGGYLDDPPLDPEKMKHRWGVRYLAGGSSAGRLEWQVGDWRPGKALKQLFHSVAGEEHFIDL